MTLPDKVYLTRGEILKSNSGITRGALRTAIESNRLEVHRFPGNKWARFLREEVVVVFELEGRTVSSDV